MSGPREPGWYWIKCNDQPEVAEWDGEDWWVAGMAEALSDRFVVVLSERLTPPAM